MTLTWYSEMKLQVQENLCSILFSSVSWTFMMVTMVLYSLTAECPICSLRIQLLCSSSLKPCVRQGNTWQVYAFCLDAHLETQQGGNHFLLSLQEEPETRLAIQEALSMMVGAYSTLEGAQRTLMEALVASYLIKVGPAHEL